MVVDILFEVGRTNPIVVWIVPSRHVAVEVEVCGWFAVCGLQFAVAVAVLREFFVCGTRGVYGLRDAEYGAGLSDERFCLWEVRCFRVAGCGTRLVGKRWVCSVSCSVLITV